MTKPAPRQTDPRGPSKQDRIALRISEADRELIEQASAALSTSVSEFVLGASLGRAREVLADRRAFALPPDRWEAFVAVLDAAPAATATPRLRRLLSEPSVLDR